MKKTCYIVRITVETNSNASELADKFVDKLAGLEEFETMSMSIRPEKATVAQDVEHLNRLERTKTFDKRARK